MSRAYYLGNNQTPKQFRYQILIIEHDEYYLSFLAVKYTLHTFSDEKEGDFTFKHLSS